MLVLELMCEAVSVVGIGVLLLVLLLLVLWLLLLRIGVRMLLLLLRALRGGEVARLLLLIGTRIGGVVAVFAWGAHNCGRYGENGYSKGGDLEGGEVRGRCCQQERKGEGGEKGMGKRKENRRKRQKWKCRPGTGSSDSGVPRIWGGDNGWNGWVRMAKYQGEPQVLQGRCSVEYWESRHLRTVMERGSRDKQMQFLIQTLNQPQAGSSSSTEMMDRRWRRGRTGRRRWMGSEVERRSRWRDGWMDVIQAWVSFSGSVMCVCLLYLFNFFSFLYRTLSWARERVVGAGRVIRVIRHRPVAGGVSQPAETVHPVRIVQAGGEDGDGYLLFRIRPLRKQPSLVCLPKSVSPNSDSSSSSSSSSHSRQVCGVLCSVNHPECILARQSA